MSMAMKFTDRDVRENPDYYYELVTDYLEQYQGEFEFLVSCKMRQGTGGDLSVGMVRGVLNCMRADPRAPMIPDPVPMPEFDQDLVPQVERGQRHLRAVKPPRAKCERTDYHTHEFMDWSTMEYCPGKYEYNRKGPYRMAATSEYGLAVAKSLQSRTVHAISYIEVEWFPNWNAAGWAKQPNLVVRLMCGAPHVLRNPFILDRQIMRQKNLDCHMDLKFCGRCLPNG